MDRDNSIVPLFPSEKVGDQNPHIKGCKVVNYLCVGIFFNATPSLLPPHTTHQHSVFFIHLFFPLFNVFTLTLSISNSNWCGHLLCKDQNGSPELVFWSDGNLNSSCRMVLLKYSWKRSRAQATQSSKHSGLLSTRVFLTTSNVWNRTRKGHNLHFQIITHSGWVTHICVSKLTSIGSHNCLSPCRRQALIWTDAGILLIQILRTIFSENCKRH